MLSKFGLKICPHGNQSLGWEEVLLGKTHLADLCQGHGDAVELVLAGAGNQGFL